MPHSKVISTRLKPWLIIKPTAILLIPMGWLWCMLLRKEIPRHPCIFSKSVGLILISRIREAAHLCIGLAIARVRWPLRICLHGILIWISKIGRGIRLCIWLLEVSMLLILVGPLGPCWLRGLGLMLEIWKEEYLLSMLKMFNRKT